MILSVMKTLSKFILYLTGWKIVGTFPEGVKQCIIIEAPHTSNLDFIWGRLCFYTLGIPVKFLIKKEAFSFPFGPILRKMGGIAVDRQKNSNKVLEVASLFRKHPELILAITPEGTRKKNSHWKKGFYYIAQHAKVPVIIAYIDYKERVGGIGPLIYPSGDYRADMAIISDFYRDKTARHPEQFSLHIFPDEKK